MTTTQDEFGLNLRPGMTSRERVERAFRLFHTVIPADSAARGRDRTPYFYRREAINWARAARQWGGDMRETCVSLAKSYLASYRRMTGGAR